MHHLAHAVPELELAGDEPIGADRHGLQEMAHIGVEEHQRHVAGLVLDDDAIGRLRLGRRGGAMLGHRALKVATSPIGASAMEGLGRRSIAPVGMETAGR
jgi:hypothetical protein